MKPTLRLMFAVTCLLAVAACDTEKVETLKSPCAGIAGSPCGPHRVPVGNQPYNDQV